MRQLLYVSDSLIGRDEHALDRLMVTARIGNALDGTTGLLWTDGERFAQVVEGDERAIADLLVRLRRDARHANLEIVHDVEIAERQFGDWSMNRPAREPLATIYEQRMRLQLARLRTEVGALFEAVIAGAGRPAIG